MAVNYLYVAAFTSAVSLVGLQWWVFSLVDEIRADGLIDGDGIDSRNVKRVLELVLGSSVTVALLVNLVFNVFSLVVLGLKTLFFVQLYPSETRKVLERLINYVFHKAAFLPLVVPPNTFQTVLWSSWLIILCALKMFQSLARDRLERLNASPAATPSKYFRVYSSLLVVLVADIIWIRLCMVIFRTYSSSLLLLMFFEPLSIAFETLQAVMLHGFQLIEISQRHSVDSGSDCLCSLTLFKSASGSLSEWKGMLTRNVGFLVDMLTLSMALSHYLIIWWLRGMAIHPIDAVLFLNFRALVGATVKRIRGYIKLRRALNALNGALPDATYEELCAFEDECAICREPMTRAKRLSCNHLFHLACLRSWLDQGITEVYTCPTCRRPLFPSNSQGHTSPVPTQVSNNDNLGSDQQRLSGHALPPVPFLTQQQSPPDAVWRGVGFDSGWVAPWTNPGMDGAGTSGSISSAGLTGVQLMMRQLASVSGNYSHNSLDNAAWNLWPSHQASASSSVPPSTSYSHRLNMNAMDHLLDRVNRVRQVLPHIPDEVIIEDLLRTNNINITVNNLLMQ